MDKRSWLTPHFEDETLDRVVAVLVPPDAPGVAEFLGKRQIAFALGPKGRRRRSQYAKTITLLAEDELRAAAVRIAASGALSVAELHANIVLNLRGLCWVPDAERLCLLVSNDLRVPDALGDQREIHAELIDVWRSYEVLQAEWNEAEENARIVEEERIEALPEAARETAVKVMKGRTRPFNPAPRPTVPSPRRVVSRLPTAIWSGKASDRAIAHAIETSALPRAADGQYSVVEVAADDGRRGALVFARSHDERTSFLELKAAAEALLPRAFARPRSTGFAPPDFPFSDDMAVRTIDTENGWPLGAFSEADIPERDYRKRVARARSAVESLAFEAMGWYQSYHDYDEASWGIYLNGERLADFSCALSEDLRRVVRSRPALELRLAVQLVLMHEWFHFEVDAMATLAELEAMSPRYRRYSDKVYAKTRLTDACLEEAFANAFSREAIRAAISIGEFDHVCSSADERSKVMGVIDDWLDFSPPGYRDWRKTSDVLVRRRFATQLLRARPDGLVRGRPLPLDEMLSTASRLRLDRAAVPLRIVEPGPFARGLPYALNRREAVALLRRFDYHVLEGRGKGSHEFWRGPDGRGFPLPRKDPVSMNVFQKLRKHFGLSKEAFMNEMREQL